MSSKNLLELYRGFSTSIWVIDEKCIHNIPFEADNFWQYCGKKGIKQVTWREQNTNFIEIYGESHI